MKLTLSARPPFSLPAVVGSHGWIRLAPFGENDPTGGLTYVGQLESGRVVEMLIQEAEGGVSVEVDSPLSEAEQAEVARQVEWMLGLGQDFSAFHALAREEPKLAHVEERAQGRVLRSLTLFEDTVKTILTTNTSWAGTIRMVKALVSQFGTPLPADPTRHAFPTPDQLATADEETLRSAAGLGYRAPYVLELARRVASGTLRLPLQPFDRAQDQLRSGQALDLEGFKTADIPTSQLRKQLLAIKGVGEYAAANLLMLLGRYDFVPVDSWALKLVSHEWYGGEPVGRAEVEAAFEHWGEWKGLAYWFWDWSYAGEA
jgi:3-methyladenine DNA glycosylase/8-oxoguanine DNA glycosylase